MVEQDNNNDCPQKSPAIDIYLDDPSRLVQPFHLDQMALGIFLDPKGDEEVGRTWWTTRLT